MIGRIKEKNTCLMLTNSKFSPYYFLIMDYKKKKILRFLKRKWNIKLLGSIEYQEYFPDVRP